MTEALTLPALVTLAALFFYAFLIMKIGMTRGRRNLSPADGKGDAAFERLCRVQVNTTEQLVLFLPALWIFALFGSPLWASLLGVLWLVGRVLYAIGYAKAFAKRGPGFLLTVLSSLALVVAGLVCVIQSLVAAS